MWRTACRLLAVLGIAFTATAMAAAMERAAPDEAGAIAQWAAPPYWTPPPAAREPLAGGRQALAGAPTALPFVALFPCRLVDTRAPAFPAPLGGGFLPPATVRSYTLTGVCGVPANAKAISLNVTVVHPTGPGFITLYPEGGTFPPVSTLNYLGNDVVVNAAVVPLSATGGISMALGVSGGDVILDTNGYYAPVSSVTSLNALIGDVTLAAGSNVTLTPSGNTLTVASAGVTFAGSGTSTTASHSDHDHLGAAWTGSGGLTINNTNASEAAFWGIGPQWGVQGSSYSSNPLSGGVVGVTNTAGGNGVFGDGGPGVGVKGRSTGNNGVYGTSSSSIASGVYGENTSSGGYGVAGRAVTGYGVLAEVSGNSGVGLEAHATGGATALHAHHLSGGTAAWIEGNALVTGNLTVTGTLSKGGGSFKIDHPLDPLNKSLYHSFVESPDMKNIYDGVVTTDGRGYANVELPEWFEALNRDFRYQLTVLDETDGDEFVHAKVVKGVSSNRFTVRTSRPTARVSWQVTGIRKDAWAEAHRIPVEEMKPEGLRGTYLHPEAFAKADSSRGDGPP